MESNIHKLINTYKYIHITLRYITGGICSILSGASSESVNEWLELSEAKKTHTITFGVEGFLSSTFGGVIMNRVTGATSLRNAVRDHQNKRMQHIKSTQEKQQQKKQQKKQQKANTNKTSIKPSTFEHVIGTGSGEIMDILAQLLETKQIHACIDKVYHLKDALQALKHIEDGHAKGKVVINCVC